MNKYYYKLTKFLKILKPVTLIVCFIELVIGLLITACMYMLPLFNDEAKMLIASIFSLETIESLKLVLINSIIIAITNSIFFFFFNSWLKKQEKQNDIFDDVVTSGLKKLTIQTGVLFVIQSLSTTIITIISKTTRSSYENVTLVPFVICFIILYYILAYGTDIKNNRENLIEEGEEE